MTERNEETASAGPAEVEKVMAVFFEDGRLKALPVKRRKRLIVLESFAARFLPGRVYPEKEVNAVISQAYADYCTIRRELVDSGFMARDSAGYWRLDRASEAE
jgi:hypothetical protein